MSYLQLKNRFVTAILSYLSTEEGNSGKIVSGRYLKRISLQDCPALLFSVNSENATNKRLSHLNSLLL